MALPRSTLSEVKSHQTKSVIMGFRVDESAISGNTSAGLLEGTYDAVIQKNGTGDYTLTFNKAFRRTPVVMGAAPIGLVDARFNIQTLSTTAVRIVWEVNGTDTNADFHLTILGFQDNTQR